MMIGRFGLPKLPAAALNHIKYPVVIDDKPFRNATGYEPTIPETEAIRQYRAAFPAAS